MKNDNDFGSDGVDVMDDEAALSIEVGDLCAQYSPRVAVWAVPALLDYILQGYAKKSHTNAILLRVVGTCTDRRAIGAAIKIKMNSQVNGRLKPLTDAISAISDKRMRNALILEVMEQLHGLGDYSEPEI